LPAAIQRFQLTSTASIEVEDMMWVADRGIATTMAQAMLATITRHRAAGFGMMDRRRRWTVSSG
jgi:hypothetical protein